MCCEKSVSGIHCDNPECDYEIEVPTFTFKEYVDRTCPKCGCVLLTNADLIAWNIIEAATESNPNIRSAKDGEESDVIIRSDGKGEITIEEAE